LLDKKLPTMQREDSTEMSNFDITEILKDEIKDYKREIYQLKGDLRDSDLKSKELASKNKGFETKLY
jgi:hypothetical protein